MMKKRKVKSLQGDSESSKKKKTTREKEISESGDQDNVLVIKLKKKGKEKLPNGNSDISKKKKEKKVMEADSENSKKKKKKKKKEEANGGKYEKDAKRRKKLSAAIKLNAEEPVAEISLVDEDCSRGMKKWILAYHQRRPGLDVIQERINDFIASYEAEQEQVRRERETRAAEEGWTTVVHHKGRKKTTDSESGVAMGSVSLAAAEANRTKKKTEDLALDFYRFQKREAHRNDLMMLQSKFEQDKKRLQQLRASRKFRPY